LLEDFKRLPRSADQSHRNWERWLKGATPNLQITFDQECAVDNSAAVLLSLGHPLLRQAAAHLQQADPVVVRLCADHESLPLGVHKFALYRWAKQGVKREEELVAVAGCSEVSEGLLALLPTGLDAPTLELPGQADFDELDAVHHRRWLNATTEHAQDNRQFVGVQIQSLTASHRARQAQAEEQVGRATNDKIRVMKQTVLDRLQPDFESRIKALELAAQSGDIHASPVLFGVIEIRRQA
jgi:ATP-dependent helicase HepA